MRTSIYNAWIQLYRRFNVWLKTDKVVVSIWDEQRNNALAADCSGHIYKYKLMRKDCFSATVELPLHVAEQLDESKPYILALKSGGDYKTQFLFYYAQPNENTCLAEFERF
jgi:hypothetical protein